MTAQIFHRKSYYANGGFQTVLCSYVNLCTVLQDILWLTIALLPFRSSDCSDHLQKVLLCNSTAAAAAAAAIARIVVAAA